MAGYWRDETATTRALAPGGWLRTGDVGYLDADGRLWLRGRLKDVVRTGGENVHASDVEGAIAAHPGVVAAAVVGLPHPRLGEMVSALVVLQAGWRWGGGPGAASPDDAPTLTLESLREHCRAAGLPGFALPRAAIARAAPPLPTNAMGKVQKPDVRRALGEGRRRGSLSLLDRQLPPAPRL